MLDKLYFSFLQSSVLVEVFCIVDNNTKAQRENNVYQLK